MTDVGARLSVLRAQIEAETLACGRAPGSVTLVGVSKRQPVAAIEAAVAAGLRDIGENYMQEAAVKFGALPPVRKHFIGHVQTNKAKRLVELFDVVQAVDRPEAGAALAGAAAAAGRVLSVLIQVNVSGKERFGCPPAQAPRLAESLRAHSSLRLEGVMAIGPAGAPHGQILEAFELAAKTLACIGGSTLSIGMSGDWREAVRAGSTMLRIGTALFGERHYE